jgi:NAD(P)-dependent dehydrogenase (short-subunit alcohol dehydrogenase family)
MSGGAQGKVAVVSGGSTGVGKAVAARLAEAGAQVVLLARRADRLDAAVREIGGQALGIPADVADPDSVRAAFAEVDKRFGKADILVNSAGAARIRAIEESSDEDIRVCVGTNLLGPIYTTREAVPLLRAAGGGEQSGVIADEYAARAQVPARAAPACDARDTLSEARITPRRTPRARTTRCSPRAERRP